MNKKKEEGFGSILGFLLVAIGFAVGVGSLWRFPYVCGSNGGAIFILVYILVILLIGIPLLTVEITMGFQTQKTAILAYKELAPGKKWYFASYLHILAAVMVFAYTSPIYAWVLTYIYRTATGFFTGMDAAAITASFDALNADHTTMMIAAVVNWVLICLVVYRGLQNGVEKISKIILPLLALIMLVCIFIGIRLPGAMDGLKFLFWPDVTHFTFHSFTTALGQAFFAIGIGMLASMVFGSYIKKKDEVIVKDASIISGAIIFAGIAAGLMIFPMVFAFGLEPSAGTGLTLLTLPNAFLAVSGGRVIGTLFYVGFYIAAFSSAIGICESIVAVFMDVFRVSRGRALALTMVFGVIIGTISICDLNLFDKFDIITSNYIIVIGAFLISIFTGWIWGAENVLDAANIRHKALRLWISVCLKYLCPVAIIIIFIGNFL